MGGRAIAGSIVSAGRVGDIGERELVRAIRRLLGQPREHVIVGPGDDAAVLHTAERQAISVDRQREGVHFERDWLDAAEIGARAVTIAASDIWAMGAEPKWVVSALELPCDLSMTDFETLIAGLCAGARAAGAEIVGGDVGLGSGLSIVTTVGGEVPLELTPLRRTEARPGDELWVVGDLGWAAAGRQLLAQRERADSAEQAACVDRFRRPATPIAWCRWAARHDAVHAMMDISDGLALDLHRLCEASGVGADLDAAVLDRAVPEGVATGLGQSSRDLALGGGDDYSMLCAVAAGAMPQSPDLWDGVPVERIGVVTAATGVTLTDSVGSAPLAPCGWDPFDGAAS